MIIRRAKLKDAAAVSKLQYDLHKMHSKFDKSYLMSASALKILNSLCKKNIRNKENLLLAAEDKNKAIGYIIAKVQKRPKIFAEKKIGFIETAYVREAYRNKGLGEIMTKKALDWFRGKGIKRIELHVHSKNPMGIGAWKKYGFKTYLYCQYRRL